MDKIIRIEWSPILETVQATVSKSSLERISKPPDSKPSYEAFGSLTIANIDFGIFVNNTKIKARLFKYDYSATEQEFSKKEDRDRLKREIEEMKKQKR